MSAGMLFRVAGEERIYQALRVRGSLVDGVSLCGCFYTQSYLFKTEVI